MSDAAAEVLAGVDLEKSYAERGSRLAARPGRVRALGRVSLSLQRGERVGLVGSSGAGKSTLVRVLAGLEAPDRGSVRFEGRVVGSLRGAERRRFRRSVQVVFQDPGSALDPRQRIDDAIAEPLHIHGLARGGPVTTRVAELLEAVGLPCSDEFGERLPHELSGGERQRVVIARALACEPEVLLLDEPVASLDVSIRGQVLNLLLELQDRMRLTLLLVAHDIHVVTAACDRLAVMYRGRIVEVGAAVDVLARPAHPYTRDLATAGRHQGPTPGSSDRAAPADRDGSPGGGCPYRDRCERVGDRCGEDPALEPLQTRGDRRVACWNSLLP